MVCSELIYPFLAPCHQARGGKPLSPCCCYCLPTLPNSPPTYRPTYCLLLSAASTTIYNHHEIMQVMTAKQQLRRRPRRLLPLLPLPPLPLPLPVTTSTTTTTTTTTSRRVGAGSASQAAPATWPCQRKSELCFLITAVCRD